MRKRLRGKGNDGRGWRVREREKGMEWRRGGKEGVVNCLLTTTCVMSY